MFCQIFVSLIRLVVFLFVAFPEALQYAYLIQAVFRYRVPNAFDSPVFFPNAQSPYGPYAYTKKNSCLPDLQISTVVFPRHQV
jgi:hypothetical protein